MGTPATFGRYRVERELGRGAMGVVYRGFDPALDRPVAIKVIRVDEKTADLPIKELEARFLREAKVAARIIHPNVVTVFDAGREGQLLYLVMELIEGQSLQDRMRAGLFPSQAEALELAAQVADALSVAHGFSVVHRDVKPANILVTADGRVKVSDFGVAKAMGDDTGLTRTGTVVGSPAYMAPEQIRGQAIDGRADVFSTGVILYELLLRKRPFPADTLTTLIFQILHEDPFADATSTATLGPEVTSFLQQALNKDPQERIADAATFAARARELAAAVRGTAVATPLPVTPPIATLPAQDSVEATGPTRMIEVPAAAERTAAAPTVGGGGPPLEPPTPPAAAAAPPPAGGRPRRTPWLLALILGAALIALLVAGGLLLRRGGGPTPDAGTALLGAGTPTPADSVTIRVAGTPSPEGESGEATPWPTITPVPTVRIVVAPTATPTPRPTRTPVPEPTAVPPTAPPVVATFRCQKGADFNVSPEEATVEINGHVIGIADDWDGKGGGKTYMFDRPGTYYVKLSLVGYPTTWIRIIVDPSAEDEIADVDTELD